MLKPLLRTLPTLSGNIKIACILSDYTKISNNDWSAYVRNAKLLPLSSNFAQKNIEANLLYSTYDFDIQRFYKCYSSVFYDDGFLYDKSNYILLNKSEAQKNRNTDFEFGCKRISYKKNDAQFAFYTPIYVEGPEDMPDYFLMNIKLKNDRFTIEKSIRIHLSKDDKRNYLRIYLERYLDKIDSNVIFCNINAKNAVYYGIDLVNGGLTKVQDNIIAKVFTRQNTINNFDTVVTNGFQRNSLSIRQILPLCWYFNVNDILDDDEKIKFKNSKLYVSGKWYKNNEAVPFYNIDTNYTELYEAPYTINTLNGQFTYKSNANNLLNMEYPSLNEAMYYEYRYTNKLNVKYNRWKMKYSSDEHPYITNLSPAFSLNQNSMYKYGTFPEKYKSLKIITDTKNNVIIPIGNALTSKDSPYINDYTLVNNYINTLNNNVSTWYHLTNDITNIYNEDIWGDVQDNKVYYKGILYDFDKIYEQYPDLRQTIDKFSVIVNLHFNPYPKEELKNIVKADTSIFISDKYVKDKTAWVSERIPEGMSSGEFNKLPIFYNVSPTFGQGNSEIVFDKLYEKSENGDFIDLLSLGYDVYELNKYYKYADIVTNFIPKNGYYDDITDKLSKNENFNLYFVDGYELLPVYKLKNVLHENNRDIVFEARESSKWILDNLYFSQHGNYYKSPYDRDTLIKLIKDYGDDKYMIPLYLKSKFISKVNFKDMLYNIYGNSYIIYNSILDLLNVYEYHPRIKDNTSSAYACDVFTKKDKILNDNYGNFIPTSKRNSDNDVLYIDGYNINNVIKEYNKRFDRGINLVNTDTTDNRTMFAKFLNMKHLLYYVSDLYKNTESEENLISLMKSIFIKKRVILGHKDNNDIIFKDYYIPFYKLYNRYRPLTTAEKINIIQSSLNEQLTEDTWNGIRWKEFTDLMRSNGITNPEPIATFNKDDNVISLEDLENNGVLLNNTDEVLGSIYTKNPNAGNYNNNSYKIISIPQAKQFNIAVFWKCNRYSTHHRCVMHDDNTISFNPHECGDAASGGIFEVYNCSWTANNNLKEYHEDDFYYKPEIFVKDLSNVTYVCKVAFDDHNTHYDAGDIITLTTYDTLSEANKDNIEITYYYLDYITYVKNNINIANTALLNYLNRDLIDILITNEIDDLVINDLPFGNGYHESMQPLGFDTINLNDNTLYDDLVELRNELLKILDSIKNSVYYKEYGSDSYIKYNNFTGINEFALLNESMKIDILLGNINIPTYIIDKYGNFIEKGYDEDEYYTLKDINDVDYIKEVLTQFLSDLKYHEENNYFTMSDDYNKLHDFDNLIGVNDYDTSYRSNNGFEVCYRKTFYKIDDNIYNLMNLEQDEYPYKDLYIYKIYDSAEYPASLRMYYTDNEDKSVYSEEITNCLYPLFDDIILQDKEYSVIYSEYAQANIYKSTVMNDNRFRYNASDIMFMYDISELPYNKEYEVKLNGQTKLCYTYAYWNELKELNNLSYRNHSILPTYSLINNCYSDIICISDDINIYSRFNINTYSYIETESYSYTYSYTVLETSEDSKYRVLTEKEGIGYGIKENKTTYGFILLDAYIDNTNSSLNIIDTKYKNKKYFTYVNEHDIYDGNYSILDSFNLLVPCSNINLLSNLFSFNELIVYPNTCVFNTYYKQTPIMDVNGYTYSYNINMTGGKLDTITLQRYFDNITPYIPQTNIISNTYCLKYKDYKYVNTDINYTNDIFYTENVNMYNYNRLRVYNSNGSYTMFEPIEYKHFNDNKIINLVESFNIVENGSFIYDELIELEKDDYVFNKFKKYILESELNTYNEDEILFLYNRYNIEYDTNCIGLNATKTEKLYTLTYKFTLL